MITLLIYSPSTNQEWLTFGAGIQTSLFERQEFDLRQMNSSDFLLRHKECYFSMRIRMPHKGMFLNEFEILGWLVF